MERARRVWKSLVTRRTERGAGCIRERQRRTSEDSAKVESSVTRQIAICDWRIPGAPAMKLDACSA